ncbi:MAG: 6-carboxytetrahydropterin synthase QueD, partial [Candidatus Rokubacteria bacterium]|nr:6-carboxytetrahydropterin synthase QueD [Candidatus Rokubacteria bacterium]
MKLSVEFSFDAAHRIMGHGGKCAWLHGHTYRLGVTVQAETLNRLGMVMDFDDLKALVEKHVLSRWDHATLLREDDPLVPAIIRVQAEAPQKVITFPQNPTAEVLAQAAAEALASVLPSGVRLARLTVWESPGCASEVEP